MVLESDLGLLVQIVGLLVRTQLVDDEEHDNLVASSTSYSVRRSPAFLQ